MFDEDITHIESNYIIFNRQSDKNITYHKTISKDDEKNIDKIWLSNTDNVLQYSKGRNFKLNEKIFMIERYLHNDLHIPYKDVIDIEILYTDENKDNIVISRYPNQGRHAIDFQSTILDTFIDCSINNIINTDKKMYIMVMVSNEKKVISEIVNRYLFIENRENRYETEHSFFRNNYMPYSDTSFYPYAELKNDYSRPYLTENKEYYNRINELEQQRETELMNIRQTFNRSLRNSQNYNLNYTENSLIENLVNLLLYVNSSELENVNVTLNEDDMKEFIKSFIFNEDNNEYKELKVKEQTSCTICLSNYEKNESVSYLNNCNHLFHTACIHKWLTDFNHKCPVCRLSANPIKNE